MTRAERQIRAAAADVEIEIESVEWEPLGKPVAPGSGPSGGWLVIERPRYDGAPGEWFTGYSVGEVSEAIRRRGKLRWEIERKAAIARVLH